MPVVALALLVGSGADAAEVDETERWVPSLSTSFAILGQNASGVVSSGPVIGPPLTDGGCLDRQTGQRTGALCMSRRVMPELVGLPSESSDAALGVLVDGSLELMTPRLLEAALRPRLFVHADVAGVFAFERNLAGSGAPGEFSAPPRRQTTVDIEEASVRGQGSRARSELQSPVVAAGGGIAFSFDLFRRRLRLKPSFEYMRQEIVLSGSVHRAVKLQEPATNLDAIDPADFRLIQLTGEKSVVYHGFGPGIELEADAQRLGPFVLSAFVSGRAYYLTGALQESLSASNEFGESASWRYEFDPWAWRAGVGLRFRWLPESGSSRGSAR